MGRSPPSVSRHHDSVVEKDAIRVSCLPLPASPRNGIEYVAERLDTAQTSDSRNSQVADSTRLPHFSFAV